MALEGTLKDFSPFDILELIDFKRKTGLLFVTSSEGETITLGFEKKGLVLAQSSAKHLDMQIGNILVRSRKLSETDRDKALSLQKGTLDRLGHILRREKFCTEEDICSSLHIQMKRVFFTLLRWREGGYIFEPQESIDYFHEFVKPVFVQPLNVKALMMEGAVMIDEWPMIEKVIPSLDLVFQRTPISGTLQIISEKDEFDFEGSAKDEDATQISTDEEVIYQLMDGQRSVAEIIEQTLYSEFFCCKTVFELLKKGLIEKTTGTSTKPRKVLPEKSKVDQSVPEPTIKGNWEAARILVQRALPDAMVLEIVISEKRATLLQGTTDAALWPNPILSIFKEVTPLESDSPIGVFESIANEVGVAFFWDQPSNYLLVVAAALQGNSAASRFRAHVATVTRCILV